MAWWPTVCHVLADGGDGLSLSLCISHTGGQPPGIYLCASPPPGRPSTCHWQSGGYKEVTGSTRAWLSVPDVRTLAWIYMSASRSLGIALHFRLTSCQPLAPGEKQLDPKVGVVACSRPTFCSRCLPTVACFQLAPV